MSDVPFNPCPEGEPGVMELGHGVRAKFFTHSRAHDGLPAGLIESHPRPDGLGRCLGSIRWAFSGQPETWVAGPLWTLHSLEPLHVEPSLLCRACGHHGFIRDGRWMPA